MNKILIINGRYLPGYKDGGPVRSILNLCEWMGDEYDIRIMCLDRDHGDDKPYPDITIDDWNTVGKAKVWYTQKFKAKEIARLSNEAELVYCCGPYGIYSIIAMILKRFGIIKKPLIMAAMGSFSPDAFAIKIYKKKTYVVVMKLLGMFKNITWSVTSSREEEELKAIIGQNAKCVMAADLARKGTTKHVGAKEANTLNMLFISRIARKKNLIVVPKILEKVSSDINVNIDIYGIAEDKDYLGKCIAEFEKLPDRIKWEYKGAVESEDVPALFSHYDAFLFPTLGENYGHVIAESLAAGCIPVISNRTPWLDFEDNNCGYVCSLEDIDSFAMAIEQLARYNQDEYQKIRDNGYMYIENINTESALHSGYRTIFNLEY